MVPIKRGKKKESSAPVVTIPQAKVKLVDTEFRPDPQEIPKSDGTGTFSRDPGLNAQVVVLDDMDDGRNDDLKFWQNFKLKWDEDHETWEMRDGTTLGALIKARFGNDFDFESDEPFDFKEEYFEGFEFLTKIVPKKNPTTGQLVGSMCHHETILPIPDPNRKKKKKMTAQPSGPIDDELDPTPEELARTDEASG